MFFFWNNGRLVINIDNINRITTFRSDPNLHYLHMVGDVEPFRIEEEAYQKLVAFIRSQQHETPTGTRKM